ncbi:hypothetical protein [Streptomyces sp. NPDC047097]|uniref:hypothetical protein n=1 Tax=Streptomyces sp. NPDC047097 TaxID=3155260 RepID=UPI0033C5F5A2
MSTDLQAVAAPLARLFGDDFTAGHIGLHFTCYEADTVGDFLRATGHPEAAATWLQGHASASGEAAEAHDLDTLLVGEELEADA